MSLLRYEAAQDAAVDEMLLARLEIALPEVARMRLYGGGLSPEQQATAVAIIRRPAAWARVAARQVVTLEEKPDDGSPWIIAGAGDGSDPLTTDENGDAALFAACGFIFDALAGVQAA